MPEKQEALATQKFVEIAGIENGAVMLKNGGFRQVILVSGMNFDLKSEEEQALIISLFQQFLNALNFSVQIVVHSRKLNIDSYLEMLDARYAKEENELLKNQIQEYREFVRALVAENAIMNKSYFVVVPFDPIKIPGVGTASTPAGIMGLFKKKSAAAKPASPAEDSALNQHIEQLNQRTALVLAGLARIGLRAVALNDEELIELFYNFYNPEAIEKKTIALAKEGEGTTATAPQ